MSAPSIAEGHARPALELERITVRYGALVANRDVSLSVGRGEVHAIVGENGAGKSTLVKAVHGLSPVASGAVLVDGEPIAPPSPAEAIARGVGLVHQHFMLVDTLTVAESVVLGDEPRREGGLRARVASWLGLYDLARAEAEVAALSSRYGLACEPRRRVSSLSVGERQRVEIVKALRRGARVLLLDEPTAVLTPPEVTDLLRVLRGLAASGGTVVLVTHKLDEVMAIADRVTVLRRGEVVARFSRPWTPDEPEPTPQAIARAMVGRELDLAPCRAFDDATDAGAAERGAGATRLELAGVCATGLADVSLAVRAGEILGVAGVEGNGQEPLCEAIAGLAPIASGRLAIDGVDLTAASAAARRARGLGYVPADRHARGVVLDLSVAENLLLGRDDAYRSAWGSIDRARLERDARRIASELDVRPPDPSATVRSLSGGNQQKILVARELARAPRVLVCAQPTRGVDLAAAARIHRALDDARTRGAAILLFSAELDELRALCDRIAVLHRGRLVATLSRGEVMNERLGALMTGAAT